MAQGNLPGLNRLWKGINNSSGERAARGLKNQLCCPLAGPVTDPDIGAALEPIRRLAAQLELFGCRADILRLEISAFDQHVGRIQIDLAILTAHHAG